MPQIQIQIKVDPHLAMGNKETDVSLLLFDLAFGYRS